MHELRPPAAAAVDLPHQLGHAFTVAVEELVGNKAIEAAATAWAMEVERQADREPRDRFEGAPADIESPPRLIEVKAFGKSNRGYDLWLEPRQVEEALCNPNFYVYVVENVRQGDPSLVSL